MIKRTITKLLIFFMLFSTILLPFNFVFASTGEGETALTSEDTTEVVSNEVEQQKRDSSNVKGSDSEKELEKEVVDNLEDRLAFLYIESKELTSPGTQNIVVSWNEALEEVSNVRLVYENEAKNTFEIKESKRTSTSILFSQNFSEGSEGAYTILGVKYLMDNEEKFFAFDDIEINALFQIIQSKNSEVGDSVGDSVAVIDVDTNGQVDKYQANNEISEAMQSVDVSDNKVKSRASKSNSIVVVLDPGHGGTDPGACAFGTNERVINLEVAKACKAELELYGIKVYMTRYDANGNPSLKERAQIAANYNADLLVSIHQNSAASTSAHGAEVYYPNKNYKPAIGNTGKAVADSIQAELVALGISDRGTKYKDIDDGRTNPDGTTADWYGIIRESKWLGVPAIIVEHAFISNQNDYNNFLSSSDKLKALGIADATGIAKAFGLSKYSQGEWVETDEGRKWQYPNGTYAVNKQITLAEGSFYLDNKGLLTKGIFSNANNNIWYYADETTGKIKTSAGFVTWNGNDYYVTTGGAVARNQQLVISGSAYYFNDKALIVKGIFVNPKKNICYYADETTGKIRTSAGFVTWNGNDYYVTTGGAVARNQQLVISGSAYYFNDKAVLVKGIFVNPNKNICYYADETTGKIRTSASFVTWNGNDYYVTTGGAVARNQQLVISGSAYYFNDKALIVKGIFVNPNKNICYYADETTGKIRTSAGFVTWNGNDYYVTTGGAVARNQQLVISGSAYYFNDKALIVKGIFVNPNKNICYYADETTGKIRTSAGFVTWNGNDYYVTTGGAVARNQKIQMNNKIYYFDSTGKLIREEIANTTLIAGTSTTTVNQMVKYYQNAGKAYPSSVYGTKGAKDIQTFCKIFYDEASAEGIRAEVAFCQAMKETGWLQFGGDVKPNQCNFAGLGATGSISGATFPDVRTGVRAQIQHLKAYANAEPLKNACVDPRFQYVKRGVSPYVEWLGVKENPNGVGWATAANYGKSIVSMMNTLLSL